MLKFLEFENPVTDVGWKCFHENSFAIQTMFVRTKYAHENSLHTFLLIELFLCPQHYIAKESLWFRSLAWNQSDSFAIKCCGYKKSSYRETSWKAEREKSISWNDHYDKNKSLHLSHVARFFFLVFCTTSVAGLRVYTHSYKSSNSSFNTMYLHPNMTTHENYECPWLWMLNLPQARQFSRCVMKMYLIF